MRSIRPRRPEQSLFTTRRHHYRGSGLAFMSERDWRRGNPIANVVALHLRVPRCVERCLQYAAMATASRTEAGPPILSAMTEKMGSIKATPELVESGIDGTAVAWALLAILGLVGFVLMTVMTYDHIAWPFDASILSQARQWVGDGTVWRVISESANIPLIVIGIGLVVVLFATHHRREAVMAAILLIAVTAGSEAVKQLVARPRPEGTDPNIPGVVYSFPSGHVLEALTIFGIIAIQLARTHASRVLVVLFAIAVVAEALLVGLSRIVLNAHYPSDALASLFAGAGVLGIYGLVTHRRVSTSQGAAAAPDRAERAVPSAT